MSVSHSESSFREAMLSRQSSLSKAKFQQVSSIATMDMVSYKPVAANKLYIVLKNRNKTFF